MELRWQADDGPLFVVFEFSLTSSTKQKQAKNRQSLDRLWQNILDTHMVIKGILKEAFLFMW